MVEEQRQQAYDLSNSALSLHAAPCLFLMLDISYVPLDLARLPKSPSMAVSLLLPQRPS